MDFWGTVLISLVTGGAVSAVVTGFFTGTAALRELRHRRMTELSRLFLDSARTAHGYSSAGGPVGVGEQVGAILLLANLGAKYDLLKGPAQLFLEAEKKWLPYSTSGASVPVLLDAVERGIEVVGHPS